MRILLVRELLPDEWTWHRCCCCYCCCCKGHDARTRDISHRREPGSPDKDAIHAASSQHLLSPLTRNGLSQKTIEPLLNHIIGPKNTARTKECPKDFEY
jgi:hypothetical protein